MGLSPYIFCKWMKPVQSFNKLLCWLFHMNLDSIIKMKLSCKGRSKYHTLTHTFIYIYQLSRVQLLATPWTTAHQASLSITSSQSLLKLTSIESVIPFNHLILCRPFSSWLQSFPASGSFTVIPSFASGGQSVGASASASVLPMNIQDWYPLGWTGWISLQSKGLLRVFSNTTVQKHQYFAAQLSLWSNSHIHTWLLEKP